MAAVSLSNVVMIILARPRPCVLFHAERYFTRKLFPVFNLRNVDDLSYTSMQSVNAMVADDVAMVVNKILRKNNPRLRPIQWASLIKDALCGIPGSLELRSLQCNLQWGECHGGAHQCLTPYSHLRSQNFKGNQFVDAHTLLPLATTGTCVPATGEPYRYAADCIQWLGIDACRIDSTCLFHLF